MSFTVRAITLDLDDTLWPFAPIGARIERVLDDWLRTHSPPTAERFPVEAMRALRERVHAENPHLGHDYSALRRMTLEHALRESSADAALADAAYDVFYAARNEVEYYPDSLDALQRIAARVPVAALTNGNADLQHEDTKRRQSIRNPAGLPALFLIARQTNLTLAEHHEHQRHDKQLSSTEHSPRVPVVQAVARRRCGHACLAQLAEPHKPTQAQNWLQDNREEHSGTTSHTVRTSPSSPHHGCDENQQ